MKKSNQIAGDLKVEGWLLESFIKYGGLDLFWAGFFFFF